MGAWVLEDGAGPLLGLWPAMGRCGKVVIGVSIWLMTSACVGWLMVQPDTSSRLSRGGLSEPEGC